MSLREEIAKTIYEAPIDGDPGVWPPEHADDRRFWLERADAILARFPYMSADRSLYDYAASLREQLNTANAKLEKAAT